MFEFLFSFFFCFLDPFLIEFLFSYFLVFFYKFPTQDKTLIFKGKTDYAQNKIIKKGRNAILNFPLSEYHSSIIN